MIVKSFACLPHIEHALRIYAFSQSLYDYEVGINFKPVCYFGLQDIHPKQNDYDCLQKKNINKYIKY